MDENQYKHMVQVWKQEGKPGTLTIGGTSYTVHTPNGDDAPVFTAQSDFQLYGTTSTSKMTGKKGKVVQGPPKSGLTDLG